MKNEENNIIAGKVSIVGLYLNKIFLHLYIIELGLKIFLGLGDVALPSNFGENLVAKCLKGNRIYRGKF